MHACRSTLEDPTTQLQRVAQVFQGWLGNRAVYAGFSFGELDWQCDPAKPVAVNPVGCTKNDHSLDGALPDDERRAGGFAWPPPQENYTYEALQGALAQAIILKRAGYDSFNWENKALLRAFKWLNNEAKFAATGDDSWQPYVENYFYKDSGAAFAMPSPTKPGKNVGFTDWTHSATALALATAPSSGSGGSGGTTTPTTPTPPTTPTTPTTPTGSAAGKYTAVADTFVRGGASARKNYGSEQTLEVKDGDGASGDYDRRAFMRFDLKAAKGPSMKKATLRIQVSNLPNGGPVNLCAVSVTTDNWDEKSMNWSNKPSGVATLECVNVRAAGTVEFDVTAFVAEQVKGDKLISFALADLNTGNKMVEFNSREASSSKPLLIVE